MRRLLNSDWAPLLFSLGGLLLLAIMASGPHAQASDRQMQTVPSPTPRILPTLPPERTPRPPQDQAATVASLSMHLDASRTDLLPGEQVTLTLWLTNTSSAALTNLSLQATIDPLLEPLEIRATQGAATFQESTLTSHLGVLEPGQTAIVTHRAIVGPNAQDGRIMLFQFNAYYDGSQALSDIVALGLPPDLLPATGRHRRQP